MNSSNGGTLCEDSLTCFAWSIRFGNLPIGSISMVSERRKPSDLTQFLSCAVQSAHVNAKCRDT
jgi:hypothetical protein